MLEDEQEYEKKQKKKVFFTNLEVLSNTYINTNTVSITYLKEISPQLGIVSLGKLGIAMKSNFRSGYFISK